MVLRQRRNTFGGGRREGYETQDSDFGILLGSGGDVAPNSSNRKQLLGARSSKLSLLMMLLCSRAVVAGFDPRNSRYQHNDNNMDGRCWNDDNQNHGNFITNQHFGQNTNTYYGSSYNSQEDVDDASIDDDEWDDEDLDDDDYYYDKEIDNTDWKYHSSTLKTSAARRTTETDIFHPPSLKYSDIVLSLRLTSELNRQMQHMAVAVAAATSSATTTTTNHCGVPGGYDSNNRQSINYDLSTTTASPRRQYTATTPTSSLSWGSLEGTDSLFKSRSVPQGLLRGGSSVFMRDVGNVYEQQQHHHHPYKIPSAGSSALSFQYTRDRPRLSIFHAKEPMGTSSCSERARRRNASITSVVDTSFSEKVVTSNNNSSNQNRGASYWGLDLKEYMKYLISNVFDIVTQDDDETDSNSNIRPVLEVQGLQHKVMMRMKRQQHSDLELALAMIYIDRACSVETPRSSGCICPPCTPQTVHRLILASLLLSITSVRGISVQDIVRRKGYELYQLLYPTTSCDDDDNRYGTFHEDDVKAQQQQKYELLVDELQYMVQYMKASLGDWGIYVMPNQMKQFREMWECKFGTS